MLTVTLNVGKHKQLVLTHENASKLLTFDFQYVFDKLWEKAVRKQTHDPEWYEKLVGEFFKKVEAEGFRDTNQRTVNLI